MAAIRIIGQVDAHHRLTAIVPPTVPSGTIEVELIVLKPQAAVEPDQWEAVIAQAWHDDLADRRQDIYDLSDGSPIDEAR